MKSRQKYFVFNKERDFARGYLEHMAWERDGVWVEESTDGNRGMMISRILDSCEKDMEWHRLSFGVKNQVNALYKISIFASNTLEFKYQGREENLQHFILEKNIDFDKKMRYMEQFFVKQVSGQSDILLHDVCGRYLWFGIEIYRQEIKAVKLEHIKVYFPKQSWISHLPEVYQANDKNNFLERYLAIFQTLYEDVNQEIKDVPLLIDGDTAEGEFLKWLAGWLDIANGYMWSEEQLRRLLRHGVELYKKRGSREGILEFVHLYTGGDAYLVEHYQLEQFIKQEGQKELLTRLYGSSPYALSVIIKKEYVPTQKEYKSVIRVIEEMKSAQMELNLIVLEPYVFLSGHSYLGINSILGEYRLLTLDGLSMLPFSVIQNEKST